MAQRRRSRPTEELHPRAESLDLLGARDVVGLLHQEDLQAVHSVTPVLGEVARVADFCAHALRQGGRMIYAGAGTSGRLGLLDAVECPPTFGSHPSRVQALMAGGAASLTRAVEGAEDDDKAATRELRKLRLGKQDVVIGIAASGRTPFVLGALAYARRMGAKTALIACNPMTVREAGVDVLINPATGPELVAGSTRLKAGTATKLVLNAISTTTFVLLGHVFRGRMIDVRPTNAKLKQRAARMVSELGGVSEVQAAKLLQSSEHSPRLALIRAWQDCTLKEAKAQAGTVLESLAPVARQRRGTRRL